MKKKSSKTEFIIVFTTINSIESAEKIATLLIREKLAVCVNIIPKIKSIYSWKKKICKEEEYLILIKTCRSLYSKLEKKIKTTHPYEVPEIISFTISEGSKSYLKWMKDETKKVF